MQKARAVILYSPISGEALIPFGKKSAKYLSFLDEQAEHYEHMADQLESNPVLSMDYLRRAFLITADERLRSKARELLTQEGLGSRAKNSVEHLLAQF